MTPGFSRSGRLWGASRGADQQTARKAQGAGGL